MAIKSFIGDACTCLVINKLISCFRLSLLVVLISLNAACGGGGGGSAGGNNAGSSGGVVLSGVFVDAIVSGLDYTTSSQSGVTDASGQFNYLAGEAVTFSVGGILLGTATGASVVTPLNLVPDATDVNDVRVLNIVRLLLSLDADGSPDNGIAISSVFQVAADSITSDVQSLSTDIEIQNLLDSITGSTATLVDSVTAEAHLIDTIVGLGIPVPGLFTVGGDVTGSTGTVVLQNNGGDKLSVTGNVAFTFAGALADQNSYNINVFTDPSGQTCTVSNRSGSISGASINNVFVNCSDIVQLSAPQNIQELKGDSQVTLSWNSVTGASSYNIYYSATSGVTTTNGTKITTANTSQMVTGLVNGIPYYFIVTAENNEGEGVAANEISSTPTASLGAPASPQNVSAQGGDGQVTISWASVSGATSYNVYWNTVSGVTTSNFKINGATSPYINTSVVNGVTFYFIVTAVNSAGESAASSEVSATPLPVGIPDTPQNVTGIGFTNSVDLHWDGVLAATSYNIYWNKTGNVTTSDSLISIEASPFNPILSKAIPPFNHSGLINGSTYYYVVTAVNSDGESASSNEVAVKSVTVDSGEIIIFDAGTMFKVNPSSGLKVTMPWTIRNPRDIAYASSGKIFVADTGKSTSPSQPGDSGHGAAIMQINPVTGEQKVISSRGLLRNPNKILIASNSDLLIADMDIDNAYNGANTIIRIDSISGGQTKFLPADTKILFPSDIINSNDGNYFVVDQNLDQLWEVDAISGSERLITAGNNLTKVYGIATTSNNDIYVADTKFDSNSKRISSLIKIIPATGIQTVVSSDFIFITDVAIDSSDNILVLEQSGIVYQVDGSTGIKTLIYQQSVNLTDYQSLSLDSLGNLLIASPDSIRVPSRPHVLSVDLTTNIAREVASASYGGRDVLLDSDGSLIVTNITNQFLARVNPDTAEVTKICCDSNPPYRLIGIALEGGGAIVATTSLHTIVRIDLNTGTVETVASGGFIGAPPDVNNLNGIAIDTNGDILAVANSGIIRIDPVNGNQTLAFAIDCVGTVRLCNPGSIIVNDSGDVFIATPSNIVKYDVQSSLLSVLTQAIGFTEITMNIDGSLVGINHNRSTSDPYRYTLRRIDSDTGVNKTILNGLGNLSRGVAVFP